jgi:hypothetical protein
MMRSDIRPEFEEISLSPARTGVFHISASRSKWRCMAIIAAAPSRLRKDADSKAPRESGARLSTIGCADDPAMTDVDVAVVRHAAIRAGDERRRIG